MHVHGHQPNVSGTALAGAHAAETAAALKRSRELREAAAKLRATSQGAGLGTEVSSDAVVMIGNWSRGAGSDGAAEDRRGALPADAGETLPGISAGSWWA